MTPKLLIVIPHSANDAVTANILLEHIFRVQGRKQIGSCLLVANDDVHPEMREKIKVTAEVTFENVAAIVAPKLDPQYANNKFRQMNGLFRAAAQTVMQQYRLPWLWLEPDCAPTCANWQSVIASAYERQPKKYMGMIAETGEPKLKFMARLGVYFQGASFELDRFCTGEPPFAIACAPEIVARATHSKLFQYVNLESAEDVKTISNDAAVIHGDKHGIFSECWRFKPEPEYASALAESLSNPVAQAPIKDLNTILQASDESRPRLSRRQLRELEKEK